MVLDRIGLLAVHPTNMQKHPIRFEVISMNRRRILAGAFLALALLVGCASPPPVQSPESGGDASSANASLPTVSTPGVNTALPDSDFSFSSVESAPEFTLNESLLSLLNSDNATLRQIRDERCYAELTLRGTLRLTYFSPYFAVQFAPETNPSDGWVEGGSAGFYEENPLADRLPIIEIDLCEVIDAQAPSIERQVSLQQLIQTDEPVTYASLCEALGQTPELSHTEDVYYDATYISGDFTASGADAEQNHISGEKISGGTDTAIFSVDGVKIAVRFIRVRGELLAFQICQRQ